jgi:hypothetical protein
LEITSVPGVAFGSLNGAQPDGVGIDTVRSVRVFGATCSPATPTLSRYCANGTGGAVAVVVALVSELFVKIDW